LGVPIGADPLEYPGPVLKRIVLDADLGLINRNELAFEIGVRHGAPLLSLLRFIGLKVSGNREKVNEFHGPKNKARTAFNNRF
jgi:hypothetical protein